MKDIIEKAIEMAREMVFDGAFVGGYKFKEAEILQALTPPDKDVEADGWVAVSERLPEDGKKVFIWGPGYIKGCAFGVYYSKDGDWLGRDNYNLNAETQEYSTRGMDVTHWMSLPKPPQCTDKPKSEGVE
jgi:hypothetical protein